ncbi:MAG TPA: twin-arginine translocase TatA/TatE family subunit [Rubricoccaceae bacterium]|nr:twin-arginine translocase TatA/TatE family subunit [Rubricoccaceae bacterium]
MSNIGPWELMLILLVVLLVFGAKRIPEIARGLGKGIREFKDATNDIKRELTTSEAPPRQPPPQQLGYPQYPQQPPQQPAPPPAQPAYPQTAEQAPPPAQQPPGAPPPPAPPTEGQPPV